MKKRISILLSIIMVFAMMTTMVGCDGGGSETSKTTVLTYDDGTTSMEYRMISKGDKVQKIYQTTVIDMSEYTDEEYELLSELMDEYDAEFSKYDCATYTCGIIDDEMQEDITIDATDMDGLQELSDAGLFSVEIGNADYVSLEATIENLEDVGFELQD